MALLKSLKKKEEGSASLPTLGMLKGSSLTELQLRKANKAVLGIAESKEPNKRGKYNQYTPEQLTVAVLGGFFWFLRTTPFQN